MCVKASGDKRCGHDNQHYLSRQLLSEAITDSAGKAGLTSLFRCRRTASTDK